MSCIIDSLLFLLNQLAQWYHTLTAPKYQAATRKSPLSSSTIYYVHWCDLVDLTVWFPCLTSLSSWLSPGSWLRPELWAERSSLPMSWLCLPSLTPFLGLSSSRPHVRSVLLSYAVSNTHDALLLPPGFEHIFSSCLEWLPFSYILSWKVLTPFSRFS